MHLDKFWKHSAAAGAIFTNSDPNLNDFSLWKHFFELQNAQIFACGAPKNYIYTSAENKIFKIFKKLYII